MSDTITDLRPVSEWRTPRGIPADRKHLSVAFGQGCLGAMFLELSLIDLARELQCLALTPSSTR